MDIVHHSLKGGPGQLSMSLGVSQKKLWQSIWLFLRKLGMTLPEDPAIPLLGIYPEDAPTCNKDTFLTMFIATLFIIARSWKEPRCPSIEEWIQKTWYIYTMKNYPAIKNNEILRQMDGIRKYHPK